MISVALFEDNRPLRKGMTALLNKAPELKVVASTSTEDRSMLSAVNPEVILLDLGLEDRKSLNVAESVRATFPECRIIVIDLLPVPEDIMEFVQAGVAGFIMKDATLEDLVNKEIAGRLPVSIHAVKSHVRNILDKLPLHSRLRIVAYSQDPGLPRLVSGAARDRQLSLAEALGIIAQP